MKIKSKVAFGLTSLFVLIILMGGLGIFYLYRLTEDSKNIVRNNLETLEYTANIISALDSLSSEDHLRSLQTIEMNVALQEGNITEPGEQKLTSLLRASVQKLFQNSYDSVELSATRAYAVAIQHLNLKAIKQKSELAQETSKRAIQYLALICTLVCVAVFSFIVNFPGYIANPIAQLTSSIKAIANKDYEERLHFERNDEFEELGQAFNQMAEKLDEYEHSNVSNLLFEKKRIETIINRMNDPVIGLDEDKKIMFVNDRALELLNLSHESLIGRYAPDVAVNNDLLRNLIIQEEPSNKGGLLKIIVAKKENYFTKESISINYTPTGEKESRFIGEVILLKNVTSFKELDLARSNFMATISHELKTPIASLQACAKLLSDKRVGNLNNEQTDIVKSLTDESSRLSKLVNELLDLAQVEAGAIKMKLESVDPLIIVEHAIEAVKFLAEKKNIKIQLHKPELLPNVKADREKTTWVLINLLTNAIRYNPENEKIVVKLVAASQKLLLTVQDFGPGIETQHLKKIFDKFYQVPGTSKGTGLGLAISREFIEAQGGSIEASSNPGEGSVFSFTLKI